MLVHLTSTIFTKNTMTKKRIVKNIVFIRASAIYPDSRLEKELESMVSAGYSVSVLAWDRKNWLENVNPNKKYQLFRIPLRAPVGKLTILFWPIWWIISGIWLLFHNWDVVHAADFNCYPPSLIVAKIKRKKLVYDIYDFFPDTAPLPRFLRSIAYFIDTFGMKYADRLIIVDHCRLGQINHDGDESVCVLYNSPNDFESQNRNKTNTDKFSIFYGGTHQSDRDILSMLMVAKELPDIEVIIAGGGDPNIVQQLSQVVDTMPNARHLGVLPYSEILSYSQECDLLFALYDPSNRNNKLASPNKLFEAMMCGKPIIVNEGVATADKVCEENCGLVVPYGDYEALKEAVLTLKNNPELRKELGENGRRAYETKYNWKIMEKRLLDLYASLEEKQ